MLLKNQWVNGEVRKYLKTNENGNNFQTLLDAAKSVIRGNFIFFNACIRNKKGLKSMT